MVQNLKKVQNRKFPNFSSFLKHEAPFKANNNREAVVVCARHIYTVNSRYNEHGYIEIPVITKSVKFPQTS